MTITHGAGFDLPMPSRLLPTRAAVELRALLILFRDWCRAADHAGPGGKLPAYLRRDIGEIDHLTRGDTFPPRQQRFESAWTL